MITVALASCLLPNVAIEYLICTDPALQRCARLITARILFSYSALEQGNGKSTRHKGKSAAAA